MSFSCSGPFARQGGRICVNEAACEVHTASLWFLGRFVNEGVRSCWVVGSQCVGYMLPCVVFRMEERVGGSVWCIHHLCVIFRPIHEAEAVRRQRVGSTPPPCHFQGRFARRRWLGGSVWGICHLRMVFRLFEGVGGSVPYMIPSQILNFLPQCVPQCVQ